MSFLTIRSLSARPRLRFVLGREGELGPTSPNEIDDAVLDQAIPAAFVIAFMNSGQACAAGTRLLMPKGRFDEIKRSIRDAMRTFTVGDPADPKTAIGPMVSQKQYERVESYIRKGIEEGAEVLFGGEGHPAGFDAGYFVKPTVWSEFLYCPISAHLRGGAGSLSARGRAPNADQSLMPVCLDRMDDNVGVSADVIRTEKLRRLLNE
jgi:hypothetical protein